MKIKSFYSKLTINDKNDLLDLLLRDKELNLRVEYDGMYYYDISLDDWLNYYIPKENVSISVRLHNCLLMNRRLDVELYLKDIDKSDIMSIENAGKKCWEEFVKLRDEYYEAIKSNKNKLYGST
jgi:DNA-directed RNA polymerase alpha subunit